jgi:hypothetical protein
MTFHVGQKVIFIGPQHWSVRPTLRLSVSANYTVAAYASSWVWPDEFVIQLFGRGDGVWYRAIRFRPITEVKTDISIFTEILKTRELERESTA